MTVRVKGDWDYVGVIITHREMGVEMSRVAADKVQRPTSPNIKRASSQLALRRMRQSTR